MQSWPARDAAHLLVRSDQMADLEAELFASGLPVEALMEKAALQVSRRLLEHPEWLHDGALVLVGPGHNGGDGLVMARELHLAGVPVRIWSPFERHKPLTASHLRHALWLGIPRLESAPDPADSALWIDGLFGTGQSRPPQAAIEDLLEARGRPPLGKLVAIDAPTGLCVDTGRVLGRSAARAATTFCLGLLKQGLVQDSALEWVGELERLDLGLPAFLLDGLPQEQPLGLRPSDRATAPWPSLPAAAPKYGRGRLLVVSGSSAYRGAALLSLLGASASGCGSLRAALPAELAEGLWTVLPHVVVQHSLPGRPAGGLNLAALADPGALERLDAVLLGPGIGGANAGDGVDEAADALAWQALQGFEGLLVLDADGLNRLAAGAPGAASAASSAASDAIDWLLRRQGPTWLTPHSGEFARLFPDLAKVPPLVGVDTAARRCGASVLLKGAHSVVASPDGRRWQVLQAAAAAARAGLGDVLAGYAAGRGAMAVAATGSAATGSATTGADGALLAAAALDHAQAALLSCRSGEEGGGTPQAIAAALAKGLAGTAKE